MHEIDFSNLDLFAITGPMASGKSSLIDAIVWCLYGRTARYGQDSKGVISAGETSCEVSFDFTIGPQWFRAVRRTGKTTESGLSEREAEEWVQDTSGAELLTKRIEALLGLDFDSFTKTVILPQGQYAEFLSSKPSDRRDLLANILELGVYARVAERAKDLEARTKTRIETIRDTLAKYAGVSRAQVEQRHREWEEVGQQIARASAQEDVLRGLAQRADTVATTLSRLTDLQAEERTRVDERELAHQKQEAAEAQLRSFEQTIAEIVMERETLGYDARYHEVVKRATTHLREHHAVRQEVEGKNQDLARVRQDLDALTRQITDQEQTVVTARRAYQGRAAALQAEITAGRDIAWLTEKLKDARRWNELQQEQARLNEEQNTLTQQLSGRQQTLAALVQQEAAKEQEFRELTQQRDRAREEEQEKRHQEVEAGHLGKSLGEAVSEENRALAAAETARCALQAAEQEAQQQRDTVTRLEQQGQAATKAVEERQRQHEAEHLRTTLHIGDPCPVCQVPVHELPPVSQGVWDDFSALQRTLAAAKATLTQARQALQEADAAVAAARARKDAAERELQEREQRRREAQEQFVSRFPGFSSLSAALGALQTQRQEVVALVKDLAVKAQSADKERQALTRQREKAQREEATLAEALRGIATNLKTGTAQLAALTESLASYLVDGSDPETVLTARRQGLMQAEQEVKTLEQRQRQAEEVLSSLNTRRLQTEGTLGVLASQQEAAAAQAEREARAARENLDLAADAPLPDLSDLERKLGKLARKQERQAVLLQREETLRQERTDVERQAAQLRADLQVREDFLKKTRQAVAQIEQDLAQARTALQAAIRESGLSDLSPDGEGLRERLTSVHEQIIALRERRSRLEAEIADIERRCSEKEQEEEKLRAAETEGRLATDLRKLLGAEFTDFLSEGAVKALMRDASVHLQRLTHGRYSFDIAYKRRAIDLQIVDHEDHRRARPTHSLSGGETFLASLAIALALSQGFREVATGKAAKTSTECLILDEGFGTLDREGLQLVTETLQELRGEEGRMVGIITHVEEVAAAMPMRIEVRRGSRTSTITVSG